MKAAWSLAVACALVLAAGCAQQGLDGATELKSVSRTPPRPVERVDRIDLFAAPPAAINWDNVPGLDGIQARVLLYQFDQAAPVLAKGSMEFAIYEGRLERESGETAQPLRVWRFTAEELASRRFRGLVGWGYAVRLGWGREVPDTRVITLSARYLAPSGSSVYSAPIAIAIAAPAKAGPVKTVLGDVTREAGGPLRLGDAKPLVFRHETIDADPPGAQHAIALVADVNADGRPDVIIGCKRGGATLFWYENPSWARHDMAAAPNLEAGGLVFDVNGDGRPDVVAGQQAGGRELYWFECPADPKGPWPKHVLENRFEQYQGLAAADVDADGKAELVVLAPRSGVLAYYDVPDDPRVSPWPASCMHEVAKGLEEVEGLAVLDTDGDKGPEIIAGTAIYRRSPKDGTWKAEPFAADYKTPRVVGADLDRDSRIELVVCESGVSRGRLAWFKSPSWTPHVLREDLFHAASLAVADFDGDGLPDVFVGESGLGRNEAPRLLVYRNLGRGRFDEAVISHGVPTHEAKVADLNGDGKPDIVGKPYDPERHVDVWFSGG